MNDKTILFFSCEPGGAETLSPVVLLVQERTPHKTIVLSYGLGAQRFAARGIEQIEIKPLEKDSALFDEFPANAVITSAASLPDRDMTERYLWHQARQHHIPSAAFLDQWQNYVARFSGPSESERLAYLPDHINCINSVGEADMTREGFNPKMLVKLGHPYLASLQSYAGVVDKAEVKRRVNIPPAARVAVFASEAIREHYGRKRGYDQYDAAQLFLEMMSNATVATTPLIKLHPKDSMDEYRRALRPHRGVRPLFVQNELTSTECIVVADIVYGMSSIMLVEAFVLGKQVISLQPGLRGEDFMVLSRLGLVPLVTGVSVDRAWVQPTIQAGRPEFTWDFDPDATLSFIEHLMR